MTTLFDPPARAAPAKAPTWTREAHMARMRAESEAMRARRYGRWGIDPHAPDADAQLRARLDANRHAVGAGATFIEGHEMAYDEWHRRTFGGAR